ncbi:MAG: rhomboid family intramembrane serine protease [Actinomycetota bacterium]|nr:rhomboid family intramembrane serine protease [Actinomycetota bacterium]
MEQQPVIPPPPPGDERCYRHPGVATGVHCTRCGRPICTECMIAAPVGHQCPTCVGEARSEYRKGPGRRVAIANAKATNVTSVILALMGIGYVLEVVAGGAGSLMSGPTTLDLVRLGASVGLAQLPSGDVVGIATGQEWRMVTAIFLHGGILHLLMNGYALWIFGPVVERELGRSRFLFIFVTTGLFASAASYAFASEPAQVGVGASGAIFGVVGAFVAYNYRHRELALAAARLRGLVPFLILNVILTFSFPLIDWRAHVGGFVAGLVAGVVAEGWGRRSARTAIVVAGFVALAIAALALAAWRTAQYRADFPSLF